MYAIVAADDDERSLSWTKVPKPAPRAGEVLIAVHATAVNRADLLQRAGRYPVPAGVTTVMGLECAGVVDAVGDGVDRNLIGRRVASLLSGGGYAEFATAPASHLLLLPDEMSFQTAAAIPEVFLTAYLNLCIEGALQPGEHVMVHAAASGVGTAALQICRELGCPAIATASGAKLDRLQALGATTVVDRQTASFLDVVASVTADGVDVILDPVGASYLGDNLAALAPHGRLVVIGLLGGTKAEFDVGALLRRQLRVVGSLLRPRSVAEKAAIIASFREVVWPWLCDGTIAPVIDTVVAIPQMADAHARLRSNETTGKVVVTVR